MINLDESKLEWNQLSGLIVYVTANKFIYSKSVLENYIYTIMKRKTYQYDM